MTHLAAALNIPENTASQRLHRALEKLRKLLRRHGILTPAAALTTLMLAETTKAVPASLLTATTTSTASANRRLHRQRSHRHDETRHLKTAAIATAAVAAALLLCATLTNHLLAQALPPGGHPTASTPPAPPTTSAATAPQVAANQDDTTADKLLDAAIKTLSDQEKSLKNLTAAGVVKCEQLNLKTGQWENADEYDMTATFAMPGLQKCRIDCPLSKSPWTNGAAPFYTEAFTLTYDGKVALKLLYPENNGFTMGEISAGRPSAMDQAASASGWTFTSLGWHDPGPEPLLDFLKARRNTPAFHAERVIDGGRECLKVSLRMVVPQRQRKASDSDKPLTGRLRAVTRDHWLDVKMGFALTRYEQHNTIEDPDGTVRDLITDKTEMRDFTEPMPGFFYPRHVDTLSLVNYIQHEKPDQRRATVDISTVKANTAIDDDTFNPEKADLTGGATSIRNPTTDKQVLIRGGTTEQDYQRQQKQLKQLVDEARARRRKASQPPSRHRQRNHRHDQTRHPQRSLRGHRRRPPPQHRPDDLPPRPSHPAQPRSYRIQTPNAPCHHPRHHATAPAPSDPEKLLNLALATIAEQQKSIKNLTATGVLKLEERQKNGQYQTADERDVTVIYDGVGGTPKCRIECRYAKTPWHGGDAPFVIEKYTLVYDGNIALRLGAPGPYGPPGHPISICEITAGLPYQIEDTAKATGWADSTLGWWQRDPTVMVEGLPMAAPTGKSFLALVREAREKPGFTTQITTDAGHDVLKLTLPIRDRRIGTSKTGQAVTITLTHSVRFWLDPQKGFALTRLEISHETDDPHALTIPSTRYRAEVTAFYEPVKGLYFPKHIDIQQFWGPPAKAPIPDARSVVDVSDVKVNTAVPDDMFNPEKELTIDHPPLATDRFIFTPKSRGCQPPPPVGNLCGSL